MSSGSVRKASSFIEEPSDRFAQRSVIDRINVFNRAEFRTPDIGFGRRGFGELFAADGSIPRTFQFTARVSW